MEREDAPPKRLTFWICKDLFPSYISIFGPTILPLIEWYALNNGDLRFWKTTTTGALSIGGALALSCTKWCVDACHSTRRNMKSYSSWFWAATYVSLQSCHPKPDRYCLACWLKILTKGEILGQLEDLVLVLLLLVLFSSSEGLAKFSAIWITFA